MLIRAGRTSLSLIFKIMFASNCHTTTAAVGSGQELQLAQKRNLLPYYYSMNYANLGAFFRPIVSLLVWLRGLYATTSSDDNDEDDGA